MHATGPFDVKLTPQPPSDGSVIGRMILDKTWHGDIEATSKGEMLAFSSGSSGSAGYVAMEQVAGSVAGRSGTFVLQHSGVMTRGQGELVISVVPDSGTGELTGLSGSMQIDITPGGKHSYRFEYEVAGE